MSLILDALKKLEQDRVARRKRPVRIASDILKRRDQRGRRKTWLWIAGLAGTALAAGALTMVFTTSFLPTAFSVPKQEKIREIPDAAALPADFRPIAPIADQVTVPIPPAKADAVGQKARAVEKPVRRVAEMSSGYSGKPKKTAVSRITPDKPAIAGPAVIPELHVTAIAWTEQRGSRRAMINDAVVSEGDSVGRAMVVDIHQDHVRLSLDGRYFSVYMR